MTAEAEDRPWWSPPYGRHPDYLLLVEGIAAIPPVRFKNGAVKREGRRPYVRLSGPLGGVRHVEDPHQLRKEAIRLYEAANALEREVGAWDAAEAAGL